jgi:diaminopimelate epimerase
MESLPFIKMHGLGNDFVVVDARASTIALDAGWIRGVADRRTGVGCDQLIAVETSDVADARMTIRNADGSLAEACGNGARCVGALLMAELGRDRVTLDTVAGIVECRASGNARVTVDMGEARLDWRDIPLAREADTLHIDLGADAPGAAVGVNLGNPHAVFFVDDAEAVDVAALGARLERHAMFPERANIEFAEIRAPDHIRMRVWERGVGVTRACGTGACATLVAAARRGLTGRDAAVELDGGILRIAWHDDGHVMMTGPVATSFRGVLEAAEPA